METPRHENGHLQIMRWITFAIVSILFLTSGIVSIYRGVETDSTLLIAFLAIGGFAWGGQLWKYVINKIK